MQLRKVFIVLFLGAFFSISLLSFLAMDSTTHISCLAERMQGTSCPINDPFAALAFHLDAFKYFGTAIVGSYVSALSLLLTLFIGLTALIIIPKNYPNLSAFSYKRTAPPQTSIRKKTRWLSLHENSPSFS